MILKLKYILKAAFLSQLLFSCTERSLEPRPEPEPVPIRLFTGIRTRATVDVFGDTPVCVAYGVRTGQYDGSWDGIATDNEIRLMPERYYPSDGSALYLRGYYPPAPLTADGRLTYRLTGEEDLMLTGEQNGSLSAPFGESDSQSLLYRALADATDLYTHGRGRRYRGAPCAVAPSERTDGRGDPLLGRRVALTG